MLGSARQLRIEHEGEWYVLRQTNRNKLILTK
ncbi:hemin uptake protein HemP [Thioalkalivibrio paradoxus ARh 1]|uniref:Hemin uptake protein HemP n=1 Tax=Thioalkalivibrio paradoxus ARh 1 TaxID=713585 RepID=W0DKT2_9GAMM|nr:hemin uptake protein HemP [Thioalkalivibrio paradoxus ARh 1]